jgi:hypothetical protein
VLGRSDEARPHFRRALELLAPAGQSDHVAPERSARWKRHAT